VCADAWTNQVLAGLGVRLPLTTTVEQVSYFEPQRPREFAVGRLPLWIWMDDPSYYGFPCYGEPTVKAAQDCGGPVASPDQRSFDVDDALLNRLAAFMATTLPASGRAQRSVRCLYTLTPDRDFVAATVPGHDAVVVGLGAAHAFKFTPTFGRLLADLAMGGTDTDLTPFRLDRPALTDPHYAPSWLV
jgi:sarcosine oxidase